MLVEKLICNARLNLLILHPFPTPSQLPQQTGAQWPICTEVPRNKNIYLQKEGEGRREEGDGGRETERGTECRPTCHSFGQLGGSGGGVERGGNVLSASSHPSLSPIPFANLYLLALYIHLSVSKQNMSHPPSLNPTHTSSGSTERSFQTKSN